MFVVYLLAFVGLIALMAAIAPACQGQCVQAPQGSNQESSLW